MQRCGMVESCLNQTRETTMNYLDDHKMDSRDLKCGWIVVFIAALGLALLAL